MADGDLTKTSPSMQIRRVLADRFGRKQENPSNQAYLVKLAELFHALSPRNGNGEAPREPSRGTNKAVQLCKQLLSEPGELSGSRLAVEAARAYQALDASARQCFFEHLVRDFSPNAEEVGNAGEAYRRDPSPKNLRRLQRAVEPPRQELFRRINMAPGGTRMLVDMRGEVLRQLSQHPEWELITADLLHLLTSWFNRGFLVRQRIDWNTSAAVLEKLIQYEAVHQIQGWRDLRRRLQADRRCYAFFHPTLPDEPVIFIEVALTSGISDRVQPLLDPDSPVTNPASADSAVFYSITNCQDGLRGVPLGSFLIKQVMEDLGAEFPRVRKFATLSPIPGFRAWLQQKGHAFPALDRPGWFEDKTLAAERAELQRKLIPLCAYYLLHARRGREPLDPVARFHFRNGARLERINWLGDLSAPGMERSAGLMVNYVYRLADVERNHELYAREHKTPASYEVEALARQVAKPAPVG
jgi:malonyl-CoA decarboxylase